MLVNLYHTEKLQFKEGCRDDIVWIVDCIIECYEDETLKMFYSSIDDSLDVYNELVSRAHHLW